MDSLTIIFILNGVFFISFFLLKNIYLSLFLSLLTLFILLFISKHKNIPSIPSSFHFSGIDLNKGQYISTTVCLIIFFVLIKIVGFNSALFTSYFIFAYFNKLGSRESYFVALIILIITAIFSISGNIKAGQDTAILAYYFLVVGVVWQMIELRKEKSSEENAPGDDTESVASSEFISRRRSYNNFTINYKAILIGIIILLFIAIILFVVNRKPLLVKKTSITPTVAPIISVVPTPFTHVPFTILNATDIRGFAGSSAATLRKAGWDKEFDFTVANYDGTASANILRYTTILKDKIKFLERDLKIQITPIVMKDATRAAEMTLILGK